MSVLRDLTQLPDSVLQNPSPIPAWRSPLRKQNKSTIVRLRSFVCIADDAPEKRVNMSSPEYYSELAAAMKQIKELQRLLGKKTMENELLKEAVEYGRAKKWIAHAPLLPGDGE